MESITVVRALLEASTKLILTKFVVVTIQSGLLRHPERIKTAKQTLVLKCIPANIAFIARGINLTAGIFRNFDAQL